MRLTQCNIDKTDRINRIVIGLLIFFAAIFGMSKTFYMILGVILVAEGLIGWCSIAYLFSKIKKG